MFRIRLKELREKARMSQLTLAKELGVAQSTIGNWEAGIREPKFDMIRKIADLFGVSIDHLLGKPLNGYDGGAEAALSESLLAFPKNHNVYAYDNVTPISRRRIPLIGEISCGQPTQALEEFECYVDTANDISADFALRARGDSMIDARITDGDIVFIKKQPMVQNGQIAAVIVEDEATLKRVYIGEDTITLLAANKAYPPMVFMKDQALNIRIMGLAVAFQSLVR